MEQSAPAKANTKRNAQIDLLKTIAMLLVIIAHCGLYQFDFVQDPSVLRYLRYWMSGMTSICVGLFLFCSGYLMFSRPLSLKKHGKRMLGLAIAHLVWSVVTVLAVAFFSGENLSVKDFVYHVWSHDGKWGSHLWYISTLMVMFLFFLLLKPVWDEHRKHFYLFILAAGILVLGNECLNEGAEILSYYLFGKQLLLNGKANFFGRYNVFTGTFGFALVDFGLGAMALEWMDRVRTVSDKRRRVIAVLAFFAASIVLFAAGYMMSQAEGKVHTIAFNAMPSVPTLVMLLAVIGMTAKVTSVPRLVEVISKNTLGIYFVHWILIEATRPYLLKLPDRYLLFSTTIVYGILLLLASLGMTMVLKKIPFLRALV